VCLIVAMTEAVTDTGYIGEEKCCSGLGKQFASSLSRSPARPRKDTLEAWATRKERQSEKAQISQNDFGWRNTETGKRKVRADWESVSEVGEREQLRSAATDQRTAKQKIDLRSLVRNSSKVKTAVLNACYILYVCTRKLNIAPIPSNKIWSQHNQTELPRGKNTAWYSPMQIHHFWGDWCSQYEPKIAYSYLNLKKMTIISNLRILGPNSTRNFS